MTPRRRIWSELLPLEVVRAPRTLALLRRHALELAIAVRPDTAAGLPDLAAACAGEGVPLAVWPMIADEDGRWASAGNAAAFGAFVARLLDALDGRGLSAAEVVFDLEPPIARVRRALAGPRGALGLLGGEAPGRPRWEDAERAFCGAVAALHARGVATSAAIVPLVLLDGPGRGWERILGTPVSAPPWGRVSAMLYTSLIAGYSRGRLGRQDAVALLAWACRAAARRFGPRAGASLGAVGQGALGDEPVYGSPAELREDVAVAAAAGVSDLALFDLGGALARPPVEAWLEAFVAPPVALEAPRPTLRARGVIAAGALLGWGAGCAPRRFLRRGFGWRAAPAVR
ncbi:hypothetical protein SOCEGT47_028070 [Sorangium cellulosum]|uniref:Uncharacterized protein n=1 Tax=Sorangium cellulosum TaxID=56 RepID=A0A4P2Q097_SORCE|nr:hypothetical protein [Sorangium cellulosum]AUX22306.1 hypothetical protein SOCEGT47_028070 [Sorangium cellulosum]